MPVAITCEVVTTLMPVIHPEGWAVARQHGSRHATSYLLSKPGAEVEAVLERCVHGRLRAAYPAAEHDIEIRPGHVASDELTSLLGSLVAAVQRAEPRCRRIVFAAPLGDVATLAAAESAGFRYVVDVDLPGASLSLAVAEPAWVTSVDMDLDRVPGT